MWKTNTTGPCYAAMASDEIRAESSSGGFSRGTFWHELNGDATVKDAVGTGLPTFPLHASLRVGLTA